MAWRRLGNADLFNTVRDNLLESGLYLGDQNFEIDKVVWRRIGTDNCLVTKESADAVDAALAATEATPEEDSPIPEYYPAVLSAIVHISNDDFWMTSCGHWNGPHQHCQRFSDVKLTCTGKSPSGTPFSKDFPTVLANLTAVANLPAKFSNKKGLFVEKPPGERKIKFRHVLFDKLEMNLEEEDSSGSESDELPPEYLIKNWPCEHDAAKRARDQMVDEFRVIPIPAYNMQSKLVHPTQYRRTLKDAVVAIRFTLKHWAISSELCDTTIADINNMRVLVPTRP